MEHRTRSRIPEKVSDPHQYGGSRPQFNALAYIIAPYLLLALLLAVRPCPPLFVRVSAWFCLTAFLLSGTRLDGGSDFDNWSIGIVSVGPAFTAFVLLFLRDPVVDCRHEDQMEDEEIKDMPFSRRAYYMLCAIVTYRGVGWNYQIPYLPPRPYTARLPFLAKRTVHLGFHFLLLDVAQTYLALNPIFSLSGPQARSMASQRWLLPFNVAAYMSLTYCTLNIWNDVASIIAVSLGFSRPDQWPVVFGRWSDAYTVRRFWSRTWHQTLRRFISEISRATARALHLTPGSWTSSHTQLFVGFALSGLAHVPGDLMLSPFPPYPFLGKSFPYFIYQAAFITLEDALLVLFARLDVRQTAWTRAVGYLWTAMWLVCSLPLFNDWHLVAGMGRHRVLDIGLIEWILKKIGGWELATLMF